MNVFRGTGLEYIQQNLDRHRFEIITDVRSQRSIDWPLRKRKPLRIFPCSMTDLFAPWHTDEMIDRIFATMALAHWHTFIITTKQAERMHDYINSVTGDRLLATAFEHKLLTPRREHIEAYAGIMRGDCWPLSNVWLGVSVEDQKTADNRIPFLVGCPALVRWISAEPLISSIDFQAPWSAINPEYPKHGIHWVVVGGESGPEARPMHPEWARFILQQCQEAGVAFFFKQWGTWAPHPQSPTPGKNNGAGLYLLANGHLGNQGDYWAGRAAGMNRVGKKEAGRLLDGREWNEFPRV